MRRIPAETWSGLVMLVLAIGVSAPGLIVADSSDIGGPLWSALFAALVVCLTLSVVLGDVDTRPVLTRGGYLLAIALSWILELTLAQSGFLPVVFVMLAAIGVSVFRLRWVFVISALNTLVIVIAHARVEDALAATAMIGVFYAFVHLAAVLSVSALLREQRMRAELGEAHVELQAASVLAEESARSAERLRIARDLHDLIGHQLTLLTLELEAARHRDGEQRLGHIDRADEVARALLGDVRGTVSELREVPQGALQSTLAAVGADVPGLDVSVRVADDVAVDEEQSAILVRAVQEIITNALRHSTAREVSVIVERDGPRIRLLASDDGEGADDFDEGNGLIGISERFAQLGGDARFEGAERPDGTTGFEVDAWIPTR